MTAEQHLTALAAHTRKWSPKINLVAPSTLDVVERRHIEDSTQLASFLPHRSARIADLGSGGGFPGLALVSLGYTDVTLVDSDSRKMSACRAFLRDQGLKANLITSRIEGLELRDFDVVTARALAALDQLLDWSLPLLKPSGVCLFLKEGQVNQEIEQAHKRFEFLYKKHPSLSSSDGCVLEITHARIR